jgi:hypothetical protein
VAGTDCIFYVYHDYACNWDGLVAQTEALLNTENASMNAKRCCGYTRDHAQSVTSVRLCISQQPTQMKGCTM